MQFDYPGLARIGNSISQTWKLAIGTGKRPVMSRKVDEPFSLAEIQRLEKDRDEAIARGDRETVEEIFSNIARRYRHLGKFAEAEQATKALAEYERTGQLSPSIKIDLSRGSTAPADSLKLKRPMKEERRKQIFGSKSHP